MSETELDKNTNNFELIVRDKNTGKEVFCQDIAEFNVNNQLIGCYKNSELAIQKLCVYKTTFYAELKPSENHRENLDAATKEYDNFIIMN